MVETMELGMKSGQILILVLLIVVVALAVGLSAASRNIINLRTSTQTEQSQRAFTAAEGGVEKVLSKLSDNVGQHQFDVGDLKAEVNVVASNVYERPINLGDVGQILLEGSGANEVKVEWAKLGGTEVEDSAGGPASVEIAQIYGNDSNSQTRWYFAGKSPRSGEDLAGGNPSGYRTCTGNGYWGCVILTIQGPVPKILRIKPFWARTSARVSGVGGDLALQTYDITSSASTDIGVTRKVQVTRTALPQLPAIFDYVLYSEGEINK